MNKMFTVYDSKAKAYLQPFHARQAGEAMRMFAKAANDVKHDFHKYGADYTLFEIGTWDEAKGQVEMHPGKINLGTGLEMRDDLVVTDQIEPPKLAGTGDPRAV